MVDLLAAGDFSAWVDWVEEFHPRHREQAAREKWSAFSLRDGVLHVDGSLTYAYIHSSSENRTPAGFARHAKAGREARVHGHQDGFV